MKKKNYLICSLPLFILLLLTGCNMNLGYDDPESIRYLNSYEELWKEHMLNGSGGRYSAGSNGIYTKREINETKAQEIGWEIDREERNPLGSPTSVNPFSNGWISVKDFHNSGWVLSGGIVDKIEDKSTLIQLYGINKAHYQQKKWQWNNYQDKLTVDFYLIKRDKTKGHVEVLGSYIDVPIDIGRLRYNVETSELGVRIGGSESLDREVFTIPLNINQSCSYDFEPCWDISWF